MKILFCMFLAGAATVAITALSALWVEHIAGPVIRAYDLTFLAWIGSAILLFGSMWFWYFCFSHLARWLDP